jgi:hypothetical protein
VRECSEPSPQDDRTSQRGNHTEGGKNGFSLHAMPCAYTTSGQQTTDFLGDLGFRRGRCVFDGYECYANSVGNAFALPAFLEAFEKAYGGVYGNGRSAPLAPVSGCFPFL